MEAVKVIGVVLVAMLRALETAGHVYASIATLKRRSQKPRAARVYSPAKYRMYTMNPTIRDLPYGADPGAWGWRAAVPPQRHQQ